MPSWGCSAAFDHRCCGYNLWDCWYSRALSKNASSHHHGPRISQQLDENPTILCDSICVGCWNFLNEVLLVWVILSTFSSEKYSKMRTTVEKMLVRTLPSLLDPRSILQHEPSCIYPKSRGTRWPSNQNKNHSDPCWNYERQTSKERFCSTWSRVPFFSPKYFILNLSFWSFSVDRG